MADKHIIAVDTYGAQRVTNSHTGKTVSAYKMGYTSAVMPVLLALYGDTARDVSPKQASYRYLQIDEDVIVRHGHILLTVSADELAKAVQITRQHYRAAVYLWRDQKWWALPDNTHADYSDPGYRVGPNFDPTGFRPPSTSTGERENAVAGITAERSQREAGGRVWWWLHGDTYQHRDLLKRHGARWSGKRKAWYCIGAELPAAIRALITSDTPPDGDQWDNGSALNALAAEVPFSNDEPCTVDEAADILGMQVKTAPVAEAPLRLFALHDTAYARHELETADGKPIPIGTRGKVILLYNHNAKHGWSYDVDFDNIGVCWSFERELTPHEPILGIKITRGALVSPGAALPPTDAEIPFVSFAIKRQFIEAGLQPVPLEPSPVVSEDDIEADATPYEERIPAIRIIKPVAMPSEGEPLDTVQSAIHTMKTEAIVTLPTLHIPNARTARIDQAYVGELTGSITGQVFCYGWAVHEGICIYLNMAGPRMAVEAIRAKLSKSEQVSVVPPDAPAVELTAGEGNSGMYHPYLHYLPEARFASLLLVHDWAVTPNYGGKSTTFIFRTSDAQAILKLKHHVMQLINIPVFDAWSPYLYDAGQRAMLVRKTRSSGGIDLLSVDLDVDAWTRLITGGLEQKIIALP
ncbi:MAG: hypothetical protein L6Q98_20755 [Anaerolineae bacterium]|nr:hypothetical protein [Anaerolineae bacterium]NUQ06640.1 hypothetical protein [Anaerolineae bacterium]